MNIKTGQHFKKLMRIAREDGILTALDYDYQITRARQPLFNWFMEEKEWLVEPYVTVITGSPANGNFRRVYHSKYYTATYSGPMFGERLAKLELKQSPGE